MIIKLALAETHRLPHLLANFYSSRFLQRAVLSLTTTAITLCLFPRARTSRDPAAPAVFRMPPAFEFRGNRGDRRPQNPKHEFTFRYSRPSTAERPLLRSKRETTPEQLKPAESADQQQGLKFAPVSDLSDSEEADMDVSDDDDDDNDASHPRKRRALDPSSSSNAAPVAPPAPKWSNPDPYTVLPPPDESRSAKVDVVKLIRKSRVDATGSRAAKTDAVTTNEDFISLGGLGSEDEDEDNERNAPENAPKGPRRDMESAFGSRKRTHDDELKGFSKKTGKPTSRYYPDASILDEWRKEPYQTGTPWLTLMPATLHPGTRLVNRSYASRSVIALSLTELDCTTRL